ncbi:MAG: DUF1573 domain-containing protein [Bacteroidales bacterium]|nr:DUF1573 domain-containing protein [Bacteroidales bacterium]
MKKSWLLMLFISSVMTVLAQSPRKSDTLKGAVISFEKTDHDFGKLFHGGDGSVKFMFKNTGSEPLLLMQPRSSCGCTVASWPKAPVMPGDTASVTVSYNTQLIGPFIKSVTIMSNAKAPVVLKIKGKVYPRPPAMIPVNNINDASAPVRK